MNIEKRKTIMTRLWQLAYTKKTLAVSTVALSILSMIVYFISFIAIYFIIQGIFYMNKPAAINGEYMIQLFLLTGSGAITAYFLNFAALMCSHITIRYDCLCSPVEV